MNTWERHGSGHRPDAPSSSLYNLQPPKSLLFEDSNTSRSTANSKERGDLSFQGSIAQVINIISQHTQNAYKNSSLSTLSNNQQSSSNHIVSKDSDQLDRSTTSSNGSVQPDQNKKNLKADYSFARTRSSPELTDTSAKIVSRLRRSRAVDTQNSHSRSRKNINSEVSGHNTRSFFDDPSSLWPSSFQQTLEASTEMNSVSNSYHDETGFVNIGEELPSVSEALELEPEEQDLVNMMASRLLTFSGQLQLPIHLASSHLPLQPSPVFTSMGYRQRNLAGMVPGNFTVIYPSWDSGMQFPQGFVSAPLAPHFPSGSSLSSNQEELESENESSTVIELNPEDNCGHSRGFDSDHGGTQVVHSDKKRHLVVAGFNYFAPSTLGRKPGSPFARGQQQKVAEHRAHARENCCINCP